LTEQSLSSTYSLTDVLMGFYQGRGSRFWWMTYTVQEERRFESTKTTSKEIANKIWKRRESELELESSRSAGRVSAFGLDSCATNLNSRTSQA
jgi:hypothetical protein